MNLLTSRDHALRIAVWSVIATEGLMFAALLVLHGGPDTAPRAPAIVFASIVALLLFIGGGALATALRRIRAGFTEAAARMLVLAGATGFGALAIELMASRMRGGGDRLGLAITGLHAAHVAASIALATWVLALVRCGRIHRRHHDLMALIGTYWYFVAGLWVFVWPVVTAHRP